MVDIDGVFWGAALAVFLTLIGLMLNLTQIPVVVRFFGIAGDATIRADARAYSLAFVVETVSRLLAKLFLLIGVSLLFLRLQQIITFPVGQTAIYLIDAGIFFMDIASAATVWVRQYVTVTGKDV